MSLAGLGIDLVEIGRMERALERRARLADRLFTEAEQEYYDLCKSAGLPHYVVESVEQALEAVGMTR